MMAATATPTATRHRPVAVSTTVGVLLFLGVTAVGGGIALILGIGAPPENWLTGMPVIASWTVPGLVLGAGFGLGSLVAAYGMLRRPYWSRLGFVARLTGHHWSWIVTLLLGLGQLVWITLELVYLPEPSPLQFVYATVGLALVLLPLRGSVRTYLTVRGTGDRP